MRIYLLYYLIEILKAEVCLKNIKTIYKTTFPGMLRLSTWEQASTERVRPSVRSPISVRFEQDFKTNVTRKYQM